MTNYIYLDGQKIKLSDETAEELRSQRKEIKVPDCIEFEAIGNNGLALKFDGDRSMYWHNGLCITDFYEQRKLYDLILVKCDREDLEVGDWAYRTDEDNPDFRYQSQYSLIINDEEYRWVDGRSVCVGNFTCNHWYKVVRRGK